MPEPEDLEAQLELLRLHRRNLVRFLQQQAEQGGSAFATPALGNGIVDARAEIAHIKAVLRGWGQIIDDQPTDVPANIASQPSLSQVAEPEKATWPARGKLPATTAIDPDGLEGYFTDVEHLRDAFRQLVAAPTLPKRLLVIHGVGGAGKSSLLRMFRIHARRAGVPIGLASGDEVKSAIDIIASWCDELQAAGVRLPATLKTLARYRAVQTTIERHAQTASAVAGKLAVKTAEGVAGSVAGAAIGSVFPIVGTVAGAAIGALVGTGGEAFSDWLSTFLKRPDIELVLDPTSELSMALLSDLEAVGARQRIVLMLDTFEQLSALEDWARELAQRLQPNILLVIAGRAIPAWGRAWSGWLAQTRVEELKPMTPEIMRELIGRYYATMHGGEPDPKQVEAIITFARGLPVVVTSAVQLWVAYGVEDFQSVKSQVVADLVDRLLEGVPRSLVPILEAAAALRWFNKELLRAVTQQEEVSLHYDELRRFPFIRPRVEGLALHDAIREIIDENLRLSDPDRHPLLHRRAAAYFAERIAPSSSEADKLTFEQLYHLTRADETMGLHLFQNTAEGIAQYSFYNRMRALMSDVATYVLRNEVYQLWREYYTIPLRWLPHYLLEADAAYQRIVDHPAAEPRLRAYALAERASLLQQTQMIAKPGGLDRLIQAVEQSNALLPKDDFRRAKNSATLGRGYVKLGKFEQALEHLQRALAIYDARGDSYGEALALCSIDAVYSLRGDWRRMLDAQRRGRELLAGTLASDSIIYCDLLSGSAVNWCQLGRYQECIQDVQAALTIRQRIGDPFLASEFRRLGYAYGLQGQYEEASSFFAQAFENHGEVFKQGDAGTLRLQAEIWLLQGRTSEAEHIIRESLELNEKRGANRFLIEGYYILGRALEQRHMWEEAERTYQKGRDGRHGARIYLFVCSLAGLVRVKHAQGDYAAITELLAEAEARAQQYEYNDHLASLRLSQAQLAWDGMLPELGRGFDAALAYYKQALIYALRYNRFLFDEVLWGGGVSSPLKPIVAQCQERTFEGQRMLAALRDWWQLGTNDIGIARPDTISPIPEGIALLEAEHITRERELGDRTPQKTILEQIASHLSTT